MIFKSQEVQIIDNESIKPIKSFAIDIIDLNGTIIFNYTNLVQRMAFIFSFSMARPYICIYVQ